jgi:outer membrane protein OmpA-like peptidoglycan-associated protein
MPARFPSWRKASAAALLAQCCASAYADGGAVQFLACPVYRDTDAGRKSGCWLATDAATGLRYDVSNAPGKPMTGRMMLVEGIPAPAGTADICGGAVLEPVRVAVLEERCQEVMLPAEGYPSKPSVLPKEYLLPLSMPRTPPPPPYSRQSYQIEFSFNDDRLMYQHVETTIERVMLYAVASKARKIVVTGYADMAGFAVQGRRLSEPAALAKARAMAVREALVRLGVPAAGIATAWRGDPQPSDAPAGLRDVSKRRVVVTIEQ